MASRKRLASWSVALSQEQLAREEAEDEQLVAERQVEELQDQIAEVEAEREGLESQLAAVGAEREAHAETERHRVRYGAAAPRLPREAAIRHFGSAVQTQLGRVLSAPQS